MPTVEVTAQLSASDGPITLADLAQLPPGAATDAGVAAATSALAREVTLTQAVAQLSDIARRLSGVLGVAVTGTLPVTGTVRAVVDQPLDVTVRNPSLPVDTAPLARETTVAALLARTPTLTNGNVPVRVENPPLPVDVTPLARESTATALLTELREKVEPAHLAPLATNAMLDQVRALLAGTLAVTTPDSRALAQGRTFLSTSPRLSVAEGGHARFLILNPSGTGRVVFIRRVELFISTGPVYGRMFVNPGVNLPGEANRPVTNTRVGSAVLSSVEVRADAGTAGLSGGVDYGLLPADRGSNRFDLAPFSVPPGASLGINVPFQGAGDAVFTAYWHEEAV